ncbi:MAG: hypothetical protein FJY36_00655 [Betaproteobacteria bacterium]|nr:hypothetical protein [Betaproteobacteria bacterium]
MMTFRRFFLSCGLLVLAGMGSVQAGSDCPAAQALTSAHFLGPWSISLAATPGQKPERSLLTLQPHPLYSDSLKGELQRGAQTLQVVADWEDEMLTFEESEDGERISATWQARLIQGQCAAALEGLRFTGSEPDASAQRFRMRSMRPH